MEVHTHSVKAKSWAGYEWKIYWQHKKAKTARYSDWGLKSLCILPENSAEGLGSRTEHWWGYTSVYKNTSEKLLHLSPKSCHNFT